MATADVLAKSFAVFDADASGTISAAELVAILTRSGGGAPMAIADAEALIRAVDINGDGELSLEEFCTLMAAPGALTLLPPPAEEEEARVAAFEAATRTVKKTSPVLQIFQRVARRDESLTALMLSSQSNEHNEHMEFSMWPDARKAAALALLTGSRQITRVKLGGAHLTDASARALASAVGASSIVEVLDIERNNLTERGLLEIVSALKNNTSLRELRMTGMTLTTAVEVALAECLDGGGVPALVKLSPAMRNANERRRVEAAISRNLEEQRKRRNEDTSSAPSLPQPWARWDQPQE